MCVCVSLVMFYKGMRVCMCVCVYVCVNACVCIESGVCKFTSGSMSLNAVLHGVQIKCLTAFQIFVCSLSLYSFQIILSGWTLIAGWLKIAVNQRIIIINFPLLS